MLRNWTGVILKGRVYPGPILRDREDNLYVQSYHWMKLKIIPQIPAWKVLILNCIIIDY